MALINEQPLHEVRPVTQEQKIPARFLPEPVLEPGHTFASVTDHISSIVLKKKTPLGWFLGLGISMILVMVLTATIGKLLLVGVGIWGIN
ncbi:MAG: hypothetical protein ABI837_09615, partial [Acidobacteriota bacterium]